MVEATGSPVSSAGLVLLVADALAFSPALSERGRGVLVGALRAALRGVSQADEEFWLKAILDSGLQATPAFESRALTQPTLSAPPASSTSSSEVSDG